MNCIFTKKLIAQKPFYLNQNGKFRHFGFDSLLSFSVLSCFLQQIICNLKPPTQMIGRTNKMHFKITSLQKAYT